MDHRVSPLFYALILLHVICSVYSAENSTCYGQDGTPNDNTPCTTGGNSTFCCSDGYYCLSNGLCEWQNGTFWTGTCSDKTWKTSSCPTFCDNAGGPSVFECSTSGGTFCCGSSSCCEDNSSSAILTLGRVSTIGYITNGILTPMTPSATTTAASSTHTTLSTWTATAGHTSSSTTSTSIPTTTHSSTTSADSSPEATASPESQSNTNTTSPTLNLGAVVGGVVGGVAVIGSLVVAIWFLRGVHKRSKKAPGVEQPQSIDSPPRYHNLSNDWGKNRPRQSGPYELYSG